MIDFRNKKVAVLGLGVEGVSSAQYLSSKGVKVNVLDKKQGENYLAGLDGYDIIVRSPGIRRNLSEIIEAQKNGAEISSQTKLFFELCPGKIIGVTGTKGKGTTSSLIYEMLKAQGEDAYLGGNIGKPPFDFLDKLTPQSWVVLELSSFQLQDLTKSAHIAVILMVTQEHLKGFGDQNYHESIEEYVSAKRNLLRYQSAADYAVINRDYPASHESDIHTEAKVFRVSRERECEEGCFVREGKVVMRYRFGSLPHIANDARRASWKNSTSSPSSLSERRSPKKNKESNISLGSAFSSFASGQASRDEFVEKEIIDVKEILLPGKHNWENVCAAVMAATLAGVSKQNIVKVLKAFRGLEHRLELVREVGGVRYYDDSFSTTPETAIAAIEAFEAPEILILGGSSKNSDFTELGRVIRDAKNVKAIIGIGLEWSNIKLKVQSEKLKVMEVIEGCKSMKEVVLNAWEIAQAGDVVLLSPACASFDMFKNYKDRGEQFKKEVNNL